MTRPVHYEIFVRRGKGRWVLLEAHDGERDQAIKRAKDQLGQNGVLAVKVTKENFDAETGTFSSVTIFKDGAVEKKEKGPRGKDEPVKLPCFKPQDLFSHHARSVIGRVLKSTLDEWQLIPMELIHRADMLEKLEARSTVLQGAVQQVAVAQAAESPGSLHQIFRQLMDLALKAMDMVIADDRKGRLKPLASDSLGAFWRGRSAGADSGYHLAAAIAKHLKGSDGWAGKIHALLGLMRELPSEEDKRKVSLETIDAFIAEIIKSAASIVDLIGSREDFGAALNALAALFLNQEDAQGKRPPHLETLAGAIAAGSLERTRGSLAERILSEIRSPARLHPDSFERELATMRHLAQKLVLGVGPHLSLEAVTEAFARRSKRLVSPEQIEAYLTHAANPDERLSRLFALEENVAGAPAKRAVADAVCRQLGSLKTEAYYALEGGPVLAALKRIAAHQSAVKAGHFEPPDHCEILKGLDKLAGRIAERAGFFKAIEAREASPADKAMALLKMLHKRMLPEGECEMRARALVSNYLKRPDFSATLLPDSLSQPERVARSSELKGLLESAGFKAKDEAAA